MSLRNYFPQPYQTYTSFLSFDIYKLLNEVHRERFPEIDQPVEVCFTRQKTLACVYTNNNTIFLHDIFNHPQTPLEVIRYVLTHELIHMIVPPEQIDNKKVAHPPRFWEIEEQRSPERRDAWSWIYLSFLLITKIDKKKECISIKSSWKKSMKHPRASIDDFKELFKTMRGKSPLL